MVVVIKIKNLYMFFGRVILFLEVRWGVFKYRRKEDVCIKIFI